MLTIFTTPKPFKGLIKTVQTNAINSWIRLDPNIEIILTGNGQGVAEFAQKKHLKHIKDIETNNFGTPLVNSVFQLATENSRYEILAYVNTDIILFPSFISAINKISKQFKNFLLVGQRTDLDVSSLIEFNNKNSVRYLINKARKNGSLHGPTGIDYFIHSKGLWDKIPKFALGRFTWDHWLIWKARQNKAVIIDGTNFITALHQNHGYAHVGGVESERFKIEYEQNEKMAMYDKMTIEDANYLLTAQGIRRIINVKRAIQRRIIPYLDSQLVQAVVKVKSIFIN